MDQITGTINNIRTFPGGWGVVSLRNESRKITGHFPRTVRAGDAVRITGEWQTSQKYGEQFKATQCEVLAPVDERSIREYLARHLPGVGAAVAKELWIYYGDGIFDVIENTPEKLTGIKGISEERAREIHEAYLGIRKSQELDIFAERHGIGPGTLRRICDVYSPEAALGIIEADPYRLIEDVDGIGWKKADGIALSMGIKHDSKRRTRAGLEYVLREAAQSGHCYLPEGEFLKNAGRVLGWGFEGEIPEHCQIDIVDGAAILRSIAADENRVAELIRGMG